jgi:hypothetical protein
MKIDTSTVAAMYLGSTAISAAYLGADQVFGGAPAFDPDYSSYITAVETADGQALEAGVKTAINDFVVGCKADGIWDALKASCILAGARTLNGALVPLVGAAPTNFNFVSGDYDRKTGLKGNGSTKYLDSNRANNADPQNDNHNAVFATNPTDYLSDGTVIGISGLFSTSRNVMFVGDKPPGQGAGKAVFLHSRTNVFSLAGNPRGDAFYDPFTSGFLGHSRASSSSYVLRGNGETKTRVEDSNAPSANTLTVFVAQNSPSPTNFSPARISFYSIGEALDLEALDTRVSDLMTAIDGAIA